MIARTDMAWPSFGDAKMPVHNDVERENEELRRRVAELEAKKDGSMMVPTRKNVNP
jgi:hypothetical protein